MEIQLHHPRARSATRPRVMSGLNRRGPGAEAPGPSPMRNDVRLWCRYLATFAVVTGCIGATLPPGGSSEK